MICLKDINLKDGNFEMGDMNKNHRGNRDTDLKDGNFCMGSMNLYDHNSKDLRTYQNNGDLAHWI